MSPHELFDVRTILGTRAKTCVLGVDLDRFGHDLRPECIEATCRAVGHDTSSSIGAFRKQSLSQSTRCRRFPFVSQTLVGRADRGGGALGLTEARELLERAASLIDE